MKIKNHVVMNVFQKQQWYIQYEYWIYEGPFYDGAHVGLNKKCPMIIVYISPRVMPSFVVGMN